MYILGANPLRKVVTSPKSSNFQSYINLLEYFSQINFECLIYKLKNGIIIILLNFVNIKHRKNEISVQKNYPWSGFFEVNIAEADFTHI